MPVAFEAEEKLIQSFQRGDGILSAKYQAFVCAAAAGGSLTQKELSELGDLMRQTGKVPKNFSEDVSSAKAALIEVGQLEADLAKMGSAQELAEDEKRKAAANEPRMIQKMRDDFQKEIGRRYGEHHQARLRIQSRQRKAERLNVLRETYAGLIQAASKKK